jgi:AGZA family xanthine/uracil permease-like MFS transporter
LYHDVPLWRENTMTFLNRFFDLPARGTTPLRELRGALTTFLTMSYILFANAAILSAAGMPKDSVLACTALAAAVCCITMGLYANFPVALASGMGINAVVAFQIAAFAGSWQVAMGVVVLDGLIVLLLVLCGLREAAMRAIPRDLRRAIAAGIGLFITFIGLYNAGLVVTPSPTPPPLKHGSLDQPQTLVALLGLLLTAFLLARRVKGALIIGVLASTILAHLLDAAEAEFSFGLPSFAVAFQADVIGAMTLNLLPFVLALVMVDFFDTLGTVTAISEQSGLRDAAGNIPGLRQVLIVDSVSASVGGVLGASSVTCYIESAAGVAEGARTGLHTVCVGLMFLAAVFLAPLAGLVPAAATAPALILVGFLMCTEVVKINFEDWETAIPAYLILVAIALTYSIAHGIGYGFIVFVAIKLLGGKFRDVHPLMLLATAAFVAAFLWGKT